MSQYCSSLAKSDCGIRPDDSFLRSATEDGSDMHYTGFLYSQSLAIKGVSVHSVVAVSCGGLESYSSFADGLKQLFEN